MAKNTVNYGKPAFNVVMKDRAKSKAEFIGSLQKKRLEEIQKKKEEKKLSFEKKLILSYAFAFFFAILASIFIIWELNL